MFLQEFPFVRFRAAKSLDATTMTTFHDLIPAKLVASVWDCLMKYKKTIPNFPQTKTCELLIIDTTIDEVSYLHLPVMDMQYYFDKLLSYCL